MLQLRGKFHADLKLAKREVAWGKLGPSDLESLYRHLRSVLQPVSGMASLPTILEHLIEVRLDTLEANSNASDTPQGLRGHPFAQQDVWRTVFDALKAPLAELADVMVDTLSHIAVVLEIEKSKQTAQGANNVVNRTSSIDVEAKGTSSYPGVTTFGDALKQRARASTNKNFLLQVWKESKNIVAVTDSNLAPDGEEWHLLTQQDQQQLLLVLYLQRLLHASFDALASIVDFAENMAATGKLKRNRLILPGRRRLQRMVRHLFSKDHPEHHDSEEEVNPSSSLEAVGDSFGKRRDPEHLPAENTFEKVGDRIRTIGHFLGSPQSAFGGRAAAAVLSVAIVGYLEPTQHFFFNERCLWATIIIAIGMSPTSGSSVFSFIMRLIGTTIAMGMALVNWYIVDGRTPGVLVLLFVFNFLEVSNTCI